MVAARLTLRFIALATGIVAAANLLGTWLLLRRVRLRHPETWRKLGEPTILGKRPWPLSQVLRRRRLQNQLPTNLGDNVIAVLQRVVAWTGYSAVLLFLLYWIASTLTSR